MNKILLLVLSSTIALGAMANKLTNKSDYIKSDRQVTEAEAKTGFETASNFAPLNNINSNNNNYGAANMAPSGEVIGQTTYDLQTNRGVCRRVARHPSSGNWHFGWTMDLQYTDAPGPERGTGYNFQDVNTGLYQPYPLIKVEPAERTGWPNMGVTASGRIFSITHTSASGMGFAYKDDENPATLWQETVVGSLVGDEDGVWARTAVDGDIIHVIISRLGASFNGADAGLNYIRSLDNGDTWSSLGGLEYNYSDSYGGMEPDSYQIDAQNGVVAVAYGGLMGEIVLYKSLDGGDNWDKTKIVTTSNPRVENLGYDYNGYLIGFDVEAYFGTDGGMAIVMDSDNKAHVAYSSSLFFNLPDNDFYGAGTYYVIDELSGIFYWNEDKTSPELIGETVMYDGGDGELGNVFYDENFYRLSHSNNVAHPLLGIDQNNTLYLSYKSLVDEHSQPDTLTVLTSTTGGATLTPQSEILSGQNQLYSDVFVLKTSDEGVNWDGPVNISNGPGTDDVFPSLPRDIDADGVFPVIYQSDSLCGTLLRTTQSFATLNELAVVTVDPDDIIDANAPVADSEPYIAAIPLIEPYPLGQGCVVTNDLLIQQYLYAMDYPDGFVTDNISLSETIDYTMPGIYTETLVAFDSNGNGSDTLYFEIEILEDVDPPSIISELECETITIVAGSPWTTPTVEVIDDSFCDIPVVILDSVDPNTVGTYTVEYSATDFAGNGPAVLTIDVNVVAFDDEGPTITSNTDFSEPINVGDGLPDLDFVVIDNVDCTDATVVIDGVDDVDTDTPGDYDITVTATDAAGNSTVETYTLTVADLAAPLITLIGPATVECQNGVFDATVDPGVNLFDLVTPTADIILTVDYSDVDCETPGTYIVVYTAEDEAGNISMATRQVQVIGSSINEYLNSLINVYPNPTRGLVNVDLSTLTAERVEIFNLNGELVINTDEIVTNNYIFDLSDHSEGVYMITITTNEGTVNKKVTLSK